MKHHSEIHIIKITVIKQSKGLNGDLKPKHKITIYRTTMSPNTDIDSISYMCPPADVASHHEVLLTHFS